MLFPPLPSRGLMRVGLAHCTKLELPVASASNHRARRIHLVCFLARVLFVLLSLTICSTTGAYAVPTLGQEREAHEKQNKAEQRPSQAKERLGEAKERPSRISDDRAATAKHEGTLEGLAEAVIGRTRRELTAVFGDLSAVQPRVIFLDAEEFHRRTKMPAWTNALFIRNQIIVPVQTGKVLDVNDLTKALRHEFVHAMTHSLSAGRCPGWLDEGLAQIIEGGDHTSTENSLRQWLEKSPPIPFALLQGGFTQLDENMVAPAYGQALWSARFIVRNYGLTGIRRYLETLRLADVDNTIDPFKTAFGLSEADFERTLRRVVVNPKSNAANYTETNRVRDPLVAMVSDEMG